MKFLLSRGPIADKKPIATPPTVSVPVRRMVHVSPAWDPFLVTAQRTNFETNISAIVGFQGSPQWNVYKAWNLEYGAYAYLNTWSDTNVSYAVYQNDTDGAALYNPFANNERRAMDLRSTAYRNGFVARCIAVMDDSGNGMFFDDVNLDSGRMFKRADGTDPQMDLDASTYYSGAGGVGYMALLGDFYRYVIATVKASRPAAKFILNPVWTDVNSPNGTRWLDARWTNLMDCGADWVVIEHGAGDTGLTNGATSDTSGFSLRSQNTYIDQLHALGTSVLIYADSTSADVRRYEMARYLDKRSLTLPDMIGLWEESPRWPNYDSIFDTDLGARLSRTDTNVAGSAITTSYVGGSTSYTPVTFSSAAITPTAPPPTSTLTVGFSVLAWQWPASYPKASAMAADGFTTIRGDVQWKDVEPTLGARSWGTTDAFVLDAAQKGLKVLPILDTSAPPYQSIAGEQFSPPTSNSAFATFCANAVSRYRAGGAFWAANPTVTPRPWDAVEIWNEPYEPNFWRPNPNVTNFAPLFIAAYNAIRAVDATIKIGLPAKPKYDNGTSVVDWGAPLFANTTIKAMSNIFLAVHPYPAPKTKDPATDTDTVFGFPMVKGTRDLAVTAGWSNPRVWITEVGWPYASPLSNSLQAQYNAAAVSRCQGEYSTFVDRYYGFIPSSAGYPEDMFTGTTDRGSYASMQALNP